MLLIALLLVQPLSAPLGAVSPGPPATMPGVVRHADQSALALSPDSRPLNEEDTRLRRLYTTAKVDDIARRYRSAGRVRDLSPTSRVLLLQVLLPEHATSVLEAFAPILADEELACVALVAVLRANAPIRPSDTVARRLARTSDGRLAMTLNTRNVPPAPRPLASLRAARLAVIEEYFFKQDSPDAQAAALERLVHLTMDAFKTGQFTPNAPAPPIRVAPRNVTDLALKLAVLPYVTHSNEFLALFDAVVNGTPPGGDR